MRLSFMIVTTLFAARIVHGQFGPQLPNAPFSAEMITTQIQTLADGTHITQPEQTMKMYRDSLGRTRTEMYMAMPNAPQQNTPLNITIMDPIEGTQYVLNTQMKTARKVTMPKRPQQSPQTPAVPPGFVSQAGAISAPFGAAIVGAPSGAMVLRANPAGNVATAIAPQSKNESLGTQTIEGLVADGHRTTTTWPVGSMGNDRELVTTNESWQSKELGIAVLSKNSDPRRGDRTTKLTNVSRAEPDSSLFQVPPDYTIEEQPAPRVQSTAPVPAAK